MRRLYFLIFIVSFLHLHVQAQRAMAYASKWQTKPSAGVNFPLTKLLKGDREDYLIDYDDNSYYWQFISATHFFNRHWGIEFNFRGATSRYIPTRYDKFVESIQAEKGNDFFITLSTSASYKTFNIVGGDIEYGCLGVIYRLESDRYYLYPKLSIGVLSYYVDSGIVYLKEKDANNVYMVSYSAKREPQDHFAPALSLATGYKVSKRIFFNIDMSTSYYKTNISFPVTTTDLNSGLETVELNIYKKDIFTLGLGAGFIIVIR